MADKMNTDYWNSFYSGIVPQAPRGTGAWGTTTPTWASPEPVGSPYLSASERAQLEQQIAASKALQANMLPAPAVASGPSWNTPTEIDLAAIDKWNAGMSGNSPGAMLAMFPETQPNPAVAAATGVGTPQPANSGGLLGLLGLLTGTSPEKPMGGLAGLLNSRALPPVTGDALVARATGATSSAEADAWRKRTYGGDGYAMGGS